MPWTALTSPDASRWSPAEPAASVSPWRGGSPRSARTVSEQPLLVVWEVLGHLDLLLDAGRVDEHVTQDGSTYGVASFALAATTEHNL